jgi:hypothetical protein
VVFVWAAWLGTAGSVAWGQVVERDTRITGPRGRSIDRQITTERGPGFVERDLKISRPAGTFERSFSARTPTAGFGGGPRPFGGNYFAGRPGFVERDVFIRGGGGPSWGTALGIGGGLFGLGLLAGNALAAPPPPPVLYAYPPPVYAAPPPAVVYNPPIPYSPAPPPQPTVMVDPVADAIGRLSSFHDNSRKDGCFTLGRLRDARAVPALIERLKYDHNKDVRLAAIWALGEIGDPRGKLALERAAVYDKKSEVRDAAASAFTRMSQQVVTSAPAASATPAPSTTTTPMPSLAPDPETPPPPPQPEPR